ncbi:hypothetical protein FA039_05875 [Escherichia coli]|nr:hypothetical protein [Escherichia coli]
MMSAACSATSPTLPGRRGHSSDERGLPVSLVSPQGEETRLAYTAQGCCREYSAGMNGVWA